MNRHRALLALLAFALGAPAHAQDDDRLVGAWQAQLRFGGALRGPLKVTHERNGWVALIAGKRTPVVTRGRSIRFDFGRRGGFRGEIKRGSIRGFWIQPAEGSAANPDPGGASQSFATPLQLTCRAARDCHGTVVPLDDQFTLWLSIFRAGDGSLMGAFRNPEANSTGGASRFNVTQNGDAVHFAVSANGREITHEAQLLHDPDRLSIDWPDVGRTLEMTRRNGVSAAAFYPRAPGSPAYVYRHPPQLSDGWRVANASETGINEQALQALVEGIATSDPTARPPQLMHSILMAHHGKLVLEEYFYGFDRLTPHDTRSAAKTFGSVMLGTAPARAAGLSPSSRIYEVMRTIGPFRNPDPRKNEITLTHLMTHASGLACNDNDDNSPGNEGTMQSQTGEPNWWRYTLNLPQLYAPGRRYAYCSANSNLVGGALTFGTHIWVPELFRRTVAEPLQFGEWHWNLMPNGEGYLGGGAFLLPRDLLKLGQLYLDEGVWNGRRIVPPDWVRESTQPVVEVSPQTTGLSEDEFGNFYGRGEDGFAWHLGTIKASGRTYRTYAATGNGGQVLLVVPKVDLAVVFTGGNYGQGGVWARWAQQIVGDKIIPAISKP
jgi:CubicO group peptidase (beta-lactamase class C family)